MPIQLGRHTVRGRRDVARQVRVDGRAIVRIHGELLGDGPVHIDSRLATTHVIVDRGAVLRIGAGVSLGHGVALACTSSVSIGDRTRIGPFAMIADTDFHVAGDDQAMAKPRPVSIGARVVIGAHSVVLPGSVIGDDVVVAAGSVVSGTVRAGRRVAGNPASDSRPIGAEVGGPRPVTRLIQETFGLSDPPAPETRSTDVPGWDSLGTVRLLLAIEQEYSTRLDERIVAELSDVAGWCSLVDGRSDHQQ